MQRCWIYVSLVEPEKPETQLPQIVALVANRQLARSPERVGSVPPERRNFYLGWTSFHGNTRRVVMTPGWFGVCPIANLFLSLG
jgi:hypothetical protein